LRRWRLLLGGDDADGIGCALESTDLQLDAALHWLYDTELQSYAMPASPATITASVAIPVISCIAKACSYIFKRTPDSE
jgi:hypothetical protein